MSALSSFLSFSLAYYILYRDRFSRNALRLPPRLPEMLPLLLHFSSLCISWAAKLSAILGYEISLQRSWCRPLLHDLSNATSTLSSIPPRVTGLCVNPVFCSKLYYIIISVPRWHIADKCWWNLGALDNNGGDFLYVTNI